MTRQRVSNQSPDLNSAVQLPAEIAAFVVPCRTRLPGEYKMSEQGQVALYASCFAAMTLHYVGKLTALPATERGAWAAYLQQWQEPATGLFGGPELIPEEMISAAHDLDYFRWHLTAHVLPALDVLDARPAYPLRFVTPYLDLSVLQGWLEARDWHNPWLEGNKLLFMGQFLIYCAEQEGNTQARTALDALMAWLDATQDPDTGLWGTQTCANRHWAVYGGYHQLLLYYHLRRPLAYTCRIIDTVLSIQHSDGGFAERSGGGACEDIDSVDILVNLGKRTAYRRNDVALAIRRGMQSALRRRMAGSGFVYRRGEPFMHGGILRTHTPPDVPDLFSTWFGVHTVAVACQALPDHPLTQIPWQFNRLLSMGWHDTSPIVDATSAEIVDDDAGPLAATNEQPGGAGWRLAKAPSSQAAGARAGSIGPAGIPALVALRGWLVDRPMGFVLRRVPQRWAVRLMASFAGRYAAAHSVPEACHFLLDVDQRLAPVLDSYAAGYAGGLAPRHWAIHHHQYFAAHIRPADNILHLGCGSGALTFAVATATGARVTGMDNDPGAISEARRRYWREGLGFFEEGTLEAARDSFDAVMITQPAENPGELADAAVQAWRCWQPKRLLLRVSASTADKRLLLRRELCMGHSTAPQPEADPFFGEFRSRLHEHGLQVRQPQVLWGVMWAEVIEDAHSNGVVISTNLERRK